MAGPLRHEFEAHPGRPLDVWLFRDVAHEAAGALGEAARTGALRPELALCRAGLVPDALCALAAAHRALSAQERGKLVTKSLHSELIVNLAASRHIGESLRRLGMPMEDSGASGVTLDVLVARFDASDADRAAVEKLMEERGAQPCDVAQLSERAQVDDIKRIFKITPEELETGSLADAVTTRIGVRDVM